MPEFVPHRGVVWDAQGEMYEVIGWWSNTEWMTVEPFVERPDGPGAGPWHVYHGEDPWSVGPTGPPPDSLTLSPEEIRG